MSTSAATILAHLRSVDAERQKRAMATGLNDRVVAVKAYQQRRFSHTYADLLSSPRYGAAARFFLDELYGPSDFTRRDAQFARVVPALVRLFPSEIVATVATLAELHALSEGLDTRMGQQVDDDIPLAGVVYVAAWQRTGQPEQRQRQIALTLAVAARLDRFTRRPLLRNSLRLMRGPARAAGLAELQQFLEAGFDTFRAMRGAEEFMAIVRERERALVSALFAAPAADTGAAALRDALAHLP
ncbi:MAG: hypothetical protein ABIQ82_10520 [Variovorax sp.]